MTGKTTSKVFDALLEDVHRLDEENRTEGNELQSPAYLADRSSDLSALVSGELKEKIEREVDPGRCRLWQRHNRDYEALNEGNCADLISSLISERKQLYPAIVRPLDGVAGADFEIIAGARRWWAIQYLRKHGYPDFKYLIEVRELTDEEAFRLSDVENRAREDLTDLERARDYLSAVELYYDGSQQRMAERMGVAKEWLSRYLSLGRMEEWVLDAFPDRSEIKVGTIKNVVPLLKKDHAVSAMKARAGELQVEHQELREAGKAPMSPAKVARQLVAAAEGRDTVDQPAASEPITFYVEGSNQVLMTARAGKKGLVIEVPHGSGEHEDELVTAFQTVLAQRAE